MNQYLLTLMVTFEQEYAIQKLFGRHGWEYSKISGDISLKNIELEETSAAVNQQVSQNTTEKTDTCSKDTRAAADTANDNQGTASGESAVNNHVNNIFNNSVTQHHDAHCGGEDGNNGNNCGGDTDTGESLESLGIVVKEEVESCDEDETFEHNLDNINDTSSKVENSGKDKRGAKCKLKVNSVIKKRRKERASSDINEEVAGGKSEFKLEELSPGDQEINDPLAVLETLPNIEHVSKVGLPHDVETFLTDANDVDDSGFSATLSAYFCKDCGHTFPEEKYYILHKRSGKCVFPCQSCDKKFTFKNFSKYQEHLKQHRNMQASSYSESLRKALLAVRERKQAIRSAAREFRVPKSTLCDRLKAERQQSNVENLKKKPKLLTTEEEDALVAFVQYMAGQGFPMSRRMVRSYVREILNKSGRETTANLEYGPSDKWFRGLLERHPQLSERTPKNLDKSRARMPSQKTIDDWFKLLLTVLKDNDLEHKESQIFNVDEVGWSGKEKCKRKVFGTKGGHVFTNSYITNDDVTVNMCICAEGKILPPMVIYKESLPDGNYTDEVPDSWLYGKSDTGYMDGDLFLLWFERIFLLNCGSERPVLLIMDNHDSYVTLPLVEMARANDVVLLGMLRHMTHILQPLEVKEGQVKIPTHEGV
ncbi:uncharacterized protein LOC123546381 isoform X1 [Mercenaria mercenaria]|uniref:uncharacterized protein LOC123546381 isoform X1 n=1 Tax=Mercenaria mercenaria TaxID=6596 RepID=UPI00234F64FD|nr:uncharacterized protein LOC123546381 isoform X1 [Mercenaria mercenaria]